MRPTQGDAKFAVTLCQINKIPNISHLITIIPYSLPSDCLDEDNRRQTVIPRCQTLYGGLPNVAQQIRDQNADQSSTVCYR